MTRQRKSAISRITDLRVEWLGDVKTIHLAAILREDASEEIRLDGQVIGFIQQVGFVFVALLGARLDRAVECKQSRSWDLAAAQIVVESRISPWARKVSAVQSHTRLPSPSLLHTVSQSPHQDSPQMTLKAG